MRRYTKRMRILYERNATGYEPYTNRMRFYAKKSKAKKSKKRKANKTKTNKNYFKVCVYVLNREPKYMLIKNYDQIMHIHKK